MTATTVAEANSLTEVFKKVRARGKAKGTDPKRSRRRASKPIDPLLEFLNLSRSGSRVFPGFFHRPDMTATTEQTNEICVHICWQLLDRLSEVGWLAAGRVIADCITSGDFPALCNYDPDVLDLPAADQSIIRQCLAFFGKRQDIDIGVDRAAAALEKFRDAEQRCAVTNSCIRAWRQGRFQFHPDVEAVLHAAQYKIAELVGDAPSLAEIRPRFGPGATTQTPKRNACALVKLGAALSCTANFTRADEALSTLNWAVGESGYRYRLRVEPCRISFVPKNAKTERAICTEPSLNGMFQLGLGDLMADLLRKVGIDIRDQGPNQRAARYASISGALATLDLSSASDTVAWLLVQLLFPEDWVELFANLRSAECIVGGEIIQLEKVSSMGNGFTFPLETMIFWAISSATVELGIRPRAESRKLPRFSHKRSAGRRVLVYGDDIIVPVQAAVPLMEVLSDLGFVPNLKKSFWEGSFRESCGHDYVFGTSVRPVYIDNRVSGFDIFVLHNFFWGKRDWEIAKYLEKLLHPLIRCRGPAGYGDGHLHSEAYVVKRSRRYKTDGFEGFTFQTWTRKTKELKKEIWERLCDERRKDGSIRWKADALVRITRLAAYTSYLAELREEYDQDVVGTVPGVFNDPSAVGPSGIGLLQRYANAGAGPMLRHLWAELPLPTLARKAVDFLVVPGEGGCKRVQVYTLEPPRAKSA